MTELKLNLIFILLAVNLLSTVWFASQILDSIENNEGGLACGVVVSNE